MAAACWMQRVLEATHICCLLVNSCYRSMSEYPESRAKKGICRKTGCAHLMHYEIPRKLRAKRKKCTTNSISRTEQLRPRAFRMPYCHTR
eukprot:6202290-Pleurochrysis_carterae.AAC.1